MKAEVIQGDCLEVMRGMADSSVDAVVCDPPYFLPAEHYKTRVKWVRSLSDLSMVEHFIGSIFEEARRVLKPEGALLAFCDGQSYPAFYVRAYRTFVRITDVVWDKTMIGMGQGVRRQHELMLVALPQGFNWNGWTRSVIACPPVPSGERTHPAEKPVELMRTLVRLMTREGATVLDPCCGSASVGVACVYEGRNFIGIEREPEYVEVARERIDRALGGQSLFGAVTKSNGTPVVADAPLIVETGEFRPPMSADGVTKGDNRSIAPSAGVVQ